MCGCFTHITSHLLVIMISHRIGIFVFSSTRGMRLFPETWGVHQKSQDETMGFFWRCFCPPTWEFHQTNPVANGERERDEIPIFSF